MIFPCGWIRRALGVSFSRQKRFSRASTRKKDKNKIDNPLHIERERSSILFIIYARLHAAKWPLHAVNWNCRRKGFNVGIFIFIFRTHTIDVRTHKRYNIGNISNKVAYYIDGFSSGVRTKGVHLTDGLSYCSLRFFCKVPLSLRTVIWWFGLKVTLFVSAAMLENVFLV